MGLQTTTHHGQQLVSRANLGSLTVGDLVIIRGYVHAVASVIHECEGAFITAVRSKVYALDCHGNSYNAGYTIHAGPNMPMDRVVGGRRTGAGMN